MIAIAPASASRLPVRNHGSQSGSQPPMREPSVRTWAACLLSKVMIPGGGFHCGFHGIAASGDHHAAVNDHMKTTMLAAQRQPIRSQVFSGSTA